MASSALNEALLGLIEKHCYIMQNIFYIRIKQYNNLLVSIIFTTGLFLACY